MKSSSNLYKYFLTAEKQTVNDIGVQAFREVSGIYLDKNPLKKLPS
jgi:hypothetical protein